MNILVSLLISWGRLVGAQLVQGLVSDVTDAITDSAVPPPAWPSDYAINLKDGDTFDYIVVGAGAGGAPAASRLALAGANVLLIEAGGDPNLVTRIPGLAMGLLGSDMDWAYSTVPNNVSCLSSQGCQCRFSRGRCLGGSSSINYMLYVRGNHKDFERWNVPGWTWEDVEPYFLRYEGLQVLNKLPPSSKPYHNMTGIMELEFFQKSENSWHGRIFQGMKSLNVPVNEDVNGVSQIGVSQTVGFVNSGERLSTARAYLTRNDVKKRLKVAKNTRCTKVILDNDNTARGVEVIVNEQLSKTILTLYATKEIILSAGTIGTAQILMLSGIGRADHLWEKGIEVKVDLPVGDNMQDHVLPLLLMQVDRGFGVDAPNLFVFGVKGVQAVQWVATRDGPLASNGLTDVTAFINTLCYDSVTRTLRRNSSDCKVPTMQLINAYIDRDLVPGAKPIVKHAIGFNDEVVQQISDANINHALIVVTPVVLEAKSLGYIRLNTTDPTDNPYIVPNYLSDERDMEEILRSITFVEHLSETSEYSKHKAKMVHLKFAMCPEYDSDREGYWRCYARHMTYSVYHAVGTAALGAVVDPRLKVLGVQALRVADASVVPVLPRGNTEAIVVAIGERVFDFIMEDNKRLMYGEKPCSV